jgi:NodT family efflux transporter outer membrane factor (OMF) lipoprotein
MIARPALVGLALVAVSGCTLGPDYKRPVERLPVATGTLPDAPELSGADPDPAWWRSFGDPLLDRLIADAATYNADLAAAAARIEQARALRAVAAGGRLPNVSANARATRSQISENAIDLSGLGPGAGQGSGGAGGLGGIGEPQNILSISSTASWELDLFGRVRRRVEAAEARVGLAEEDRNGLLLTIIADVAQNYTELRNAQAQMAVAQDNVATAQHTADLTRLLVERQLSPEFDLARALGDVRAAEADLEPLRAQIRANNAALAALTGCFPEELADELLAPKPLAVPQGAFAAGLPSELLRRRPDIRLAERRLAAETADIGGEIADLYPSFSLSGMFGFSSMTLDTLFSGGSEMFSVGAALDWPIFSGGRARAEVAEARAGAEEARALYRASILNAFRDADRALSAYVFANRRVTALEAALAERERALTYARLRFVQGLDSQLVLLDAQRQRNASQAALVSAQGDMLVAIVGAYRALGGGWEAAGSQPSEAAE